MTSDAVHGNGGGLTATVLGCGSGRAEDDGRSALAAWWLAMLCAPRQCGGQQSMRRRLQGARTFRLVTSCSKTATAKESGKTLCPDLTNPACVCEPHEQAGDCPEAHPTWAADAGRDAGWPSARSLESLKSRSRHYVDWGVCCAAMQPPVATDSNWPTR